MNRFSHVDKGDAIEIDGNVYLAPVDDKQRDMAGNIIDNVEAYEDEQERAFMGSDDFSIDKKVAFEHLKDGEAVEIDNNAYFAPVDTRQKDVAGKIIENVEAYEDTSGRAFVGSDDFPIRDQLSNDIFTYDDDDLSLEL